MSDQHITASTLPPAVQQLIAEIRTNPRLQTGLLMMSAIVLLWALFSLDDLRKSSITKLETLRSTNTRMQTQLGSPAQQTNLQLMLGKTQEQIDTSLWHFPAPVIAQTEFSDWLKTTLKENGITDPVITQPSFRSLNEQQNTEKKPDTTHPSTRCGGALCDLIEIRANVRFRFTPATFAKALASLENSKELVRIDQATFNTQTRLAELSLVTHARIKEEPNSEKAIEPPRKTSASEASAIASVNASASEPKKVVEIKW